MHDEASDRFQDGPTEEALAPLREILEKQPRSSFAYQKLAYALLQLGRTPEAVRVLEEAASRGVTDLSLLPRLVLDGGLGSTSCARAPRGPRVRPPRLRGSAQLSRSGLRADGANRRRREGIRACARARSELRERVEQPRVPRSRARGRGGGGAAPRACPRARHSSMRC